MPSGCTETLSEDCLVSAQTKVPLAFSLNLFGIMDIKNCPLTGKLNYFYLYCIFEINHNPRNQCVQMLWLKQGFVSG